MHLTHERTTVALNSESRRPHKRAGRPTAYRRDYCNVVLALGLQGASLGQMWRQHHSDGASLHPLILSSQAPRQFQELAAAWRI